MNMPGFTAEASVYKTNLQYRLSGMQGNGMRNSITLSSIPSRRSIRSPWFCYYYYDERCCYNSVTGEEFCIAWPPE